MLTSWIRHPRYDLKSVLIYHIKLKVYRNTHHGKELSHRFTIFFIADQKCIDSDIINEVHTVLARQFSDIKGFQNKTFAPQFNTVEQKWISNTIFTDIMGRCTNTPHMSGSLGHICTNRDK
jgi:hypothetical protein